MDVGVSEVWFLMRDCSKVVLKMLYACAVPQ